MYTIKEYIRQANKFLGESKGATEMEKGVQSNAYTSDFSEDNETDKMYAMDFIKEMGLEDQFIIYINQRKNEKDKKGSSYPPQNNPTEIPIQKGDLYT